MSISIPLAGKGLTAASMAADRASTVEHLAQPAVGIHCPVERTIAADEMGIADVVRERNSAATLRAPNLCDEVPLAKTSGFQIGSADIGLNCSAAEQGTRGSRFHFAECAREVKG